MDSLLETVYYNPKSPAVYGGIDSVYREAKKKDRSLNRSYVKRWLEKQYVYSLHKPVKRKFVRNKVYASGVNDQFQIDLADMQALAKHNKGYRYLFNCICVFSKYAWAIPVKNKTGKEMVRAMQIVLSDRKPNRLQSDEGMEFRNKIFQSLLKQNNIHFFTSKNREIKAAIVERFNRTIKTKLWKHFTKTRSYRYLDVIKQIVNGYNKSYHRSIKMAPCHVNKGNESLVRERLYGVGTTTATFKYKVDDNVRVSKIKGRFAKGYLPNWSEEIFTISDRLPREPVMYRLIDYNKEAIEGLFYEHELQQAQQEKFWIDKVIKRQKGMALVSWTGYPEKFNSWIPISAIEKHG